jgi:8-oxo-dGTP pyrophosphatase MutT (NUDIX family)
MTRRAGGTQRIPRPDTWRAGDTPAWTGRDLSVLSDSSELTRRLLEHFSTSSPTLEQSLYDPEDARASAVLVPLLTVNGVPEVVLTRRAEHLNNHKGEISFPGGRLDEGESVFDAALREADEEIALKSSDVEILGTLDSIMTFVSKSFITPVVGSITGSPTFVASPAEVARVFTVPLPELVRADTYRNEWWLSPRGEINIHFFELDDETIWGATGRILTQFINIVTAVN